MPGRNYQSSLNFPYGYQGQEKDQTTGLTNFELRQYDPRIGRWYNPDPMGQHHSSYLAMSNNPISFTDADGGWDSEAERDGYNNNLYSFYQHMSYTYNSDAFGRSQFDDNYSHGGPMGGSINADGSFYSSSQQIYEARITSMKYKASQESTLGDLAPQIASFPKYRDQEKGNDYTVGVEVAVGPSADKRNQESMYLYMKWKDEYNARRYGSKLFNGVPTQDTYINGELSRAGVWRQYGKNFNDLADFSEKAVVGIGVGAGLAMGGGIIIAEYGIFAEGLEAGVGGDKVWQPIFQWGKNLDVLNKIRTLSRVDISRMKTLGLRYKHLQQWSKLYREAIVKNNPKSSNLIAKNRLDLIKKIMELW